VTSRRADACALLILALLATALFADVLAGVNWLYMRDLTRYFYPIKQILRQIVQHGEFPYWNPNFSAGQPLAANPQHEVFYPPTWLILLPSYDLGFRILLLLHVYIGLFAMYALLRSMDLRPFAATIGALGWGLGGFYLSYLNLLPILFCAAWLPATCLFARRFLLRPNGRDFAAAAIFLGLQLLVGEPTTILQTGLLLGAYALYRGWYAVPRFLRMSGQVVWVGVIFATALLVAAAQVLPAIDHVRDSARSRPFDFAIVSTWSMPWARLAELAYPNLLGHISVDRVTWYWGGNLYPGTSVGYLFSIYSGLLLLALVVGGAFSRPRGGRLVLSLCAVSVLLALGSHTPLLRFLYDHGGLSSLRYPEKFLLLGVFPGVVFAAQVLQRIVDGDEVARRGALGFAIAAASLAAILAIASFFPAYSRVFLQVWGQTSAAGAQRMVALSRFDWLVATLRGALLVALLATVHTRRRAAWSAAMVTYLAADLGYVSWEINPRMPHRFFDPPPVVETLLPDHADYRIFHQTDGTDGPEAEMARLYFQTGDGVYWVLRNGLFPMTPAGSGLRTVMELDYDQMLLLPTIDLLDSVADVKSCGYDEWYEPFLAFSNVWYRGVYRPFEAEKARIRGNFKESLPVAFLEGLHYPRYYFADQIVTIRDREDFAEKLCGESFSPAAAFVARPAFAPARGVVRQVAETANHATLDVESFGQGLLVMSVTPHKYWRVTIDGARVDPIVTNLAYQSILVPKGRHRVEMRYRNELVIVGLWISAVTTGLLLGLVAGGRRRSP